MPTSFRKDLHRIPPRYRTPSPPRDAFEPFSPVFGAKGDTTETTGLQWADDTRGRNRLKRQFSAEQDDANCADEQTSISGGAMDVFASIALATKANRSRSPTTSTSGAQPLEGSYEWRPTKRARSEKLPSPEWSRIRSGADSRPATSYEQPPEDRRFEAELLLNFAQTAAKLISPSPVLRHASLTHTREASETTMHGRLESNDNGQSNEAAPYLSVEHRPTDDMAEKSKVEPLPQNVPQNGIRMGESPPSAKESLEIPTILPLPFATELVDEAPESIELSCSSPRMETRDLSKDDVIDLTPDRPLSEPATAAEQTKTPDAAKTSISPNASSPSAIAREEVASPEQRAFGNEILVSTEVTLPSHESPQVLDDTAQIEEGDARLKGEPIQGATFHELQQLPEEEAENDSRTIHGVLGNNDNTIGESPKEILEDAASSVPEIEGAAGSDCNATFDAQIEAKIVTAVCAACSLARNNNGMETENNATSWISCDACKSWFHFACAGFKNEREVRGVDKFRCRKCKPIYGSTTYVRKSSRAHSAIDYAGLHQGVIKTSDERPEHHYIKPIKDGTITFLPENFARMCPELVTAEFFEKGTGMKEPVVIPACLNPRSNGLTDTRTGNDGQDEEMNCLDTLENDGTTEEWFSRYPEPESVPDHGQDALDMVIPRGLTVRQVAELYGPDEKVEVIDVKSQNGENKKWNMRRWADYYENPNNKVVRNVISLEVSQSKLGRLIRRPQIVRDLDLQDSVWPEELIAKGEYPRVQFYTLMSVADCFTDFHIDFGGSSVFYHILKGRKTFLFIPPKEKFLKKYEEWCMSPAQNWTFLGDQTKECYRVDLLEGDTMLIPSGWIHAVWTPEDSLVIGGNFLTRMNYGMQLRVAQVEKATGVARKFRYPHFQKLHWYTAIRYLERDPLPDGVREKLHAGDSFHRDQAAYVDFDFWGENSRTGPENYHARYYSQSELEGLPDLTRYLLRTALIDIGSITDGISADTRNAVKKSIPRGHGEPLDIMKSFAAWCAWKRGNEPIPHWAYPDAVPENLSPDKLSAAATKKLDREAALSAPRRQSARMQSQQEALEMALSKEQAPCSLSNPVNQDETKRSSSVPGSLATGTPKRPKSVPGTGTGSHRKTACDSCRKRRRACKHKDEVASSMAASLAPLGLATMSHGPALPLDADIDDRLRPSILEASSEAPSAYDDALSLSVHQQSTILQPSSRNPALPQEMMAHSQTNIGNQATSPEASIIDLRMSGDSITRLESGLAYTMQARPRHKACNECRKSKRRCIHDAFGNEDPVKVRETAIPRPHARKSNFHSKESIKRTTSGSKQGQASQTNVGRLGYIPNPPALQEQAGRMAPVANMIARSNNLDSQTVDVTHSPDAIRQRKLAESASLLLDPALFQDDGSSFLRDDHIVHPAPVPQPMGQEEELPQSAAAQLPERPEDPFQMETSFTAHDTKVGPVQLEQRESFEQPASSLVSPPASPHDDTSNDPTAANAQWTSSRSSSEQFGEQPKQMQRYTPESGPIRRASSSSYSEKVVEKVPVEALTEPPPRPNAEAGPNFEFVTDDESFRLIKELQAQDLGLRRRGRA